MIPPFDDLSSDDLAEIRRHFSVLGEVKRQVDENEEIRQIEAGLAIKDENALVSSGFRGLATVARHESELQGSVPRISMRSRKSLRGRRGDEALQVPEQAAGGR